VRQRESFHDKSRGADSIPQPSPGKAGKHPMPVPRVVTKLNKATAHALESVGGLLQYPPDYPCIVVTETEVVIQV